MTSIRAWRRRSVTAGNVSMVPNTTYGEPVKPTLTQFNEVPDTQAAAAFNVLKAATSPANTTVDYGYLPASDVPEKSSLSNVYNFEPWTGWQMTYFPENFTNPTSGPIFNQLSFRQAVQDLVDQNTSINNRRLDLRSRLLPHR